MNERPVSHPDDRPPPEAADEPEEFSEDEPIHVLLFALAVGHLQSASEVCARHGRVAIPIPARGDVPRTGIGTPVLIYAPGAEDRKIPSVTWRATFAGWSEPSGGSQPSNDQLVPPTMIEERDGDGAAIDPDADGSAETPVDPAVDTAIDTAIGDVPDPDPDEDEGVPDGVFVELTGLEQMPARDWVSTNELVPKQRRGARYFMPREPKLVRLPP